MTLLLAIQMQGKIPQRKRAAIYPFIWYNINDPSSTKFIKPSLKLTIPSMETVALTALILRHKGA